MLENIIFTCAREQVLHASRRRRGSAPACFLMPATMLKIFAVEVRRASRAPRSRIGSSPGFDFASADQLGDASSRRARDAPPACWRSRPAARPRPGPCRTRTRMVFDSVSLTGDRRAAVFDSVWPSGSERATASAAIDAARPGLVLDHELLRPAFRPVLAPTMRRDHVGGTAGGEADHDADRLVRDRLRLRERRGRDTRGNAPNAPAPRRSHQNPARSTKPFRVGVSLAHSSIATLACSHARRTLVLARLAA